MNRIRTPVLISIALILSWQVYAVEQGEPAPDFALPEPGGEQTHSLSDYLGSVVYVDFWATWCAPCKVSLPLYEKLHEELASRGLVMIAVNIDRKPAKALRFLDEHPVNYLVLSDPKAMAARAFAVPSMPSAYLIDRRGIVRMVHHGFDKDDLGAIRAAMIDALDTRAPHGKSYVAAPP